MDFWDLTPYEFGLMVKAYTNKREESAEEKITLAYMQAAWTIQFLGKKKPDLKKILNKKNKENEMTDEEMLEKIKALNSMFGGEVIGG